MTDADYLRVVARDATPKRWERLKAIARNIELMEADAGRYRLLRSQITFCNTHPGGRPVLYDTSARLWYHATDDLETDTIDAHIDAELAKVKP